MLSEKDGTEILRRCFADAGLRPQPDHPITVAGKKVHLDGFDAERNIGFEYLTHEANDREELTPDVIAELEAKMQQGELFVLLIDEGEVESAAMLERAAQHFLGVLRSRGRLPSP